ncbi:preprotein translocase subunit SecY [bacterium]|nr:preprotein translocase subunit SecY [bacterium]MCK5598427.1 preprotein translocase subunit SecY [bacterium]
MLKGFANIFKVKDLTRKLWITFLLLLVFRFGKHIPVPGINSDAIIEYMQAQTQGTLLSLYDMFTGGAFSRVTIFALGIMPYITSSIIVQLLVYVIPEFKRLHDEGERGNKVLTQYTRYGTILICIMQSLAYAKWISGLNLGGVQIVTINPVLFMFVAVLTFTAGTVLLMWVGETITEIGIGNGISLIILIGIVARLIPSIIEIQATGGIGFAKILLLIFIVLLVTVAAIMLTLGARKIPIMYPKRIQGRRVVQGAKNYLPLRVNSASVIPIIFAQSVMMIPTSLAAIVKHEGFRGFVNNYFAWDKPLYIIIFFFLVIGFTFFYTAITFNPDEISDNLKKYGAVIQNKRPGKKTAAFLHTILSRVTFIGAMMLAIIAILPTIITALFHIPAGLSMLFGGTSLLIMVGVVLDTIQQIEGQLIMRHYDGFSKRRIKSRHM